MKSAMCVHEHHLVNSCTKWGSEQIKETSDRSCCQFVRRALIISVATVLLTGIASSHLLLSDDNDVAVAISSRTNKAYYLGLDSELQDLFRIRGGSDSHSHESWLEETTKPPFARSNMILNRNGRLLFDEGDFAKAWQSRHDVETIFELDGKVGKKSIRVKFRSDSIALSLNKTNVFAYKLWSRVIPDEGTWWINYLDQGNSTEKTLLHIYLVKKRPAMWPRINIPNVQIKPETPCSSENILPIPPPAMEISQDVRGQIRRLQPPQVRIRAKLEDGELARDAPLSVLQVGDEVEVMGSTMGTIIDYDSIRMLYTVDLRDEGEVKLKANRLKRIRTSSQSKNLLSSDTLAAASLKEGASTSERNSSSIIPLHLPSTGAQTGRAAKSFAIPWIPMYSKLKSSSVGSENKLEDLHHKVSLISTQLIGNKTNGEEVVPTAANENQDDVGLKLQFQQDPETLRISERARVHGLFKGLPKVDSRVYHKRFEPEPVKEMGFSERELRILNGVILQLIMNTDEK
mmetsp:Transcript_23766/g.38134  ORF Transcript_23766/g.38134 Transcript_23766/m.38134 type:complete len:516 (+) Transcript_23766:69-1616(+)